VYPPPVPAVPVPVPGYRRVNRYTGTGLRRAGQCFLEKNPLYPYPYPRPCTRVPAHPRTRVPAHGDHINSSWFKISNPTEVVGKSRNYPWKIRTGLYFIFYEKKNLGKNFSLFIENLLLAFLLSMLILTFQCYYYNNLFMN
jgi:hypothetical protein